ncbi:MAG: MBL fold metallo-hydrolase [Deltaproteobacteria bacterium]|nr:MBL fold metallo-hydrolase [Deltaproteobacteria bacterium]
MLIDCGMFQGLKKNRLKNWDPFPIPPSEIDRVFLTHAHIDHSGYLPRFCKDGFTGKIHCTYATHDLCEIMLRDSGHIQEEDAYWANKKGYSKHRPARPLYTVEDAEKALSHFEPLYYGQDLFVTDRLRVRFRDAGHILGSSFVDVKTMRGNETRRVLFSGDVGRPARPILRDPVQVFEVDYLVLESTYGNRLHDQNSPQEELARVINESVERGGVLVIPAFAVGRTQELLFNIRELEEQERIPSLTVFVDSPMAIDVTSVQAINKETNHAIVISASGMVTGGRILHHLKYRLPNPNDTILFIGYQAEGTRGRTILEGEPEVKIHGKKVPVRAKIENISGFSAHADYNEILAWLMGFNRPPLKTFIVHGEPDASTALAEKIREKLKWDVVIPKFEEAFELD